MRKSNLSKVSAFSYIVSFDQKARELDNAAKWLDGLGFGISKTRLGQYKKDVSDLAEAFRGGKIDDLLKTKKLHKLYNSLNEADELTIIYRGLSHIVDEPLLERLKKFIKGPEYVDRENLSAASYVSRDVAFELYIASHLAIAGYKIDFGTEADLKVIDHTTLLFVECKRPKTTGSIEKNIREACKQLTKRYDAANNSTKVRGFIALSISKSINPNQMLLLAKSDEDRENKLGSIMSKFFNEYSDFWQKELDIRTIGALFHVQVPCIVQDKDMFGACHKFGVNNIALVGSSDFLYFEEVFTNLEKGQKMLLLP